MPEKVMPVKWKLFTSPSFKLSPDNIFDESTTWVTSLSEDLQMLEGRLCELQEECRQLRKLEKRMNKLGLWKHGRYVRFEQLHEDILEFYACVAHNGVTYRELFVKVEEDWIVAGELTERSRALRDEIRLEFKKR
jgi:hypothetical protein